MLVPYNDPSYYSRRPTIAIPAGNVLQVGADRSNVALGLHPRLTGLRQIFNQGRLALIQRTGYPNQSRSHFQGTDIWATANPANSAGPRLARPLSRHAPVAARSADRLEHDARPAARAAVRSRAGAGDSEPAGLRVQQPEQPAPRRSPSATRPSGSARTCPSIEPELAFVYASQHGGDGHARSRGHGGDLRTGTVTYPEHRLRPGDARRRRRDGRAGSARGSST